MPVSLILYLRTLFIRTPCLLHIICISASLFLRTLFTSPCISAHTVYLTLFRRILFLRTLYLRTSCLPNPLSTPTLPVYLTLCLLCRIADSLYLRSPCLFNALCISTSLFLRTLFIRTPCLPHFVSPDAVSPHPYVDANVVVFLDGFTLNARGGS